MMTAEIVKGNISVTMASNPLVGLAPFYIAMDKGIIEKPVEEAQLLKEQ